MPAWNERWEPARCPECGQLADRLREQMLVDAPLVVREEAGKVTYSLDESRDSQPLWDSSRAWADKEGYDTLVCENEHGWEAKRLPSEEEHGPHAGG